MTPSPWPSPEEYAAIRAAVADGWADDLAWSEAVGRPADAETMARELVWVVINSGMSSRVTRAIEGRVLAALDGGRPVFPDAFGHAGKAAAIERMWRERRELFDALSRLRDDEMPGWLETLPWIGGITKWHAARNLGADVAKPDRWLVRLAELTGETPQGMCERVSARSGDRIGTVDLVLWRACAEGMVSPEGLARALAEQGRLPAPPPR